MLAIDYLEIITTDQLEIITTDQLEIITTDQLDIFTTDKLEIIFIKLTTVRRCTTSKQIPATNTGRFETNIENIKTHNVRKKYQTIFD